MNGLILVCTFVALSLFCAIATAAPIDDPAESTTITSKDAEKTVTKRHILRNIAQNFASNGYTANTVGAPFANRPLYNFFHPNNPNNNAGVTGGGTPMRPFAGLFNRPILAALQAQQTQQAIPALQDEVQDLQAVSTMPGVQGVQGFHGLQGLHPFQSVQSLQGMHPGMSGPFGGGGAFHSHLPSAHYTPDIGMMGYSNVLDAGNHHGYPLSMQQPTITMLGRQSPQFVEGNQYFLATADGYQQMPFHNY